MFSVQYLPNIPLMILCTCILYRIFGTCLTLRPQKILRAAFFLILFCLSSPIILPGEVTGSLGILIFLGLSVSLFCTNSPPVKIAVTLILYPIWVSFYYLTENAGYVIWLHAFHQQLSPLAQGVLALCFYILRIPFWLLVYRFTKRWLTPSKTTTFHGRIWFIISVLCLASFLGIITLIAQADPHRTYMIWPACVACILTNIGICYLCAFIEESTKAAMEADVLRAQRFCWEALKARQLQTQKLRHDMKNHLSVIRTLLHQNKKEDAEAYLHSLSREMTPSLYQFCRQETINAILNSKYRTARSRGIDCRFLAEIPQDTGFDPVALCSLIANTLDNAIEACLRVSDPHRRRILLKSRCTKDWFSYCLENSAPRTSSESGKKSGGLGLQIVRGLTDRYNGTLEILRTEDQFSITILLPVPKKEKGPCTDSH